MSLKKTSHQICFTVKNKQTGALKHNLLIIVPSIIALSLLAWLMLPASFSTDLSRIGQGRPAVVLIYDFEDGRSPRLMKYFNKIRDNYEDEVYFLVSDVASPQGQKFSRAQGTSSIGAHFFSRDGNKLLVLEGVHEIDTIKKALNQLYGI